MKQELRSKLESIATASMDGFWAVDGTGIILYANRIIAAMHGYTPDELVGTHLRDFEEIEDEAALQQHVSRIIATGFDRFETRHHRKDGTWFDAEVSTVYAGADNIFIAFIRDITEQKSAESTLKSSELKYRRLYETIIDGYAATDMSGNILDFNNAFQKMLGYSSDEITSLTYHDITPERWHAAEERIVSQETLVNGFSGVYEKEYRRKDGSVFPVELRTYLIKSNQGAPVGMWAIVRDISERKCIEQQLKVSEEKFRTIAELSPDIISIITTEGNLAFNSSQARHIHGYTDEDLEGRNTFELIHPDDQAAVSEAFSALLASADSQVSIQYRYRNKDGSYTWMEATARNHINNPLINGIVSISRDISQRKNQEEEHMEMERSLMHLQKLESLGVLAGGIAHDFNNILTSIIGNISYARTLLDSTHKAALILSNAEKAANRAGELASQLLTFSKGGDPIKQVVSLHYLLEESVPFVLRGTNVTYRITPYTEDILVEADAGQLVQAINNLVINAAQAMPGGGAISISTSAVQLDTGAAGTLPTGRYARLVIADTGCGIPPDNLHRIFEPYYTTKAGGSGLGLATSYSIITRHGGQISVASTTGAGTTFTILLPLSSGAAPSRLPDQAAIRPDLSGRKQTIMVMDDEEMIREITSFMLSDMGYEVATCADGTELLELYRNALAAGKPYSAVIMDLTVPGGMGGKETAPRLLELDPNICLIVSSGYSSDPVMADFASYGFRAVLKKPYSIDALSHILSEVLS